MDKVVVEADGGSRGNPGPSGYGAVVWDADREHVLAERKEFLGVATNNVAEYRGLIAGLEAAAELGAREVSVRMDSKLVVEQMSGRWKVKHESMIPLADRARRLVAGFDRVSFAWIPRKENSHADQLANEAMDDAHIVDEVRTALAQAEPVAPARVADSVPAQSDSATSAQRESAISAGPALQNSATSAAAVQPDSAGSATAVQPDSAGSATAVFSGSASSGAAAQANSGPSASPAPGWTGAVGRPTRMLLLRHGQTELSVERRYSGRGNPALTEVGRGQAASAAKMLATKGNIAAIVSSPLGRARETAEAAGAALGLPVRVLDGLIETDFGAWEGLSFREAAEQDPELHARWLGDPSVAPPGGESFDQVRERIEGVRRDLVALYPGANVLVVSHVTPIKMLLQLALGVGPSLLYRLHLDLASLSIAEFYPDGGSSVRLANDTSYL
ncbi:bifunctional RNase H/acid phosphatase [Nocardia sp. SYP-A9097]|uniref:bifunctional RNase H/acid phosphatase n=1 Tax=Nocardia sp. SYP-A9097 TaxID=2663237 RepID=UPI00129AFE9A|nr:bifunctional RNase H/acid phosphatase [Nocardia sp. SYP-A9097]MRH92035.1 bifunctional RNase H/acid phosphatase [Nocardia sp. SYP-A9097]